MRLAELGLPASVHNFLLTSLSRPGLVLICGTAGSGKTDTANALVAEGVSFGRVRKELGAAISSGAPDIVDAGDLREVDETLRAIAEAQATVVIGVLRSGFGTGAIERFRDMG